MLTLFEEITKELTDYETEIVLPLVIKGLKTKIGKENATKNEYIVRRLMEQRVKTSTPRIRKIIHHIRVNDIIPRLIATSQGYYITNDSEELDDYILSLGQRLNSIKEIRDSLKSQR